LRKAAKALANSDARDSELGELHDDLSDVSRLSHISYLAMGAQLV